MMLAKRLIAFLNKESERPKEKMVTFAVITGITNALLLAIVNHAAALEAGSVKQIEFLLIYGLVLTLFIYAKNYSLSQAAIMVEEIMRKVRVRVADKIRHTELNFIENTGQSFLYNHLSQGTTQISQSANVVFASLEAAIMLIFAMIYIALLTWDGFLVTLTAVSLGTWVFLQKRKAIITDLENAVQHEVKFFEAFNHTLDGFSEVKINQAKSNDLFAHQERIARDVEHYKTRAGINSVFVMIFSEIFLYILIGTIIFVWPLIIPTAAASTIKLTASILFIIGPIDMLVGSMPLFMKSDVAVANLEHLEALLDQANKGGKGDPQVPKPLSFHQIEFKEVQFDYLDAEGKAAFSVGPINLTLRRNEIIFIVGGNGSGKSTLVKLLCGLYYPAKGSMLIDGQSIDVDNYGGYRELFSIIFTDFHLFDRFYGLDGLDEERLQALLSLMELDKKTKFLDGRFSNLKLSTGQRKRLAFIVSVMENKDIYIFDEWAADQDPTFRKYFYEYLLPDLRNEGKTIVAVTHDDKYFHTADRVLKMEEGHFVEYHTT